jgi:hypothetical protein
VCATVSFRRSRQYHRGGFADRHRDQTQRQRPASAPPTQNKRSVAQTPPLIARTHAGPTSQCLQRGGMCCFGPCARLFVDAQTAGVVFIWFSRPATNPASPACVVACGWPWAPACAHMLIGAVGRSRPAWATPPNQCDGFDHLVGDHECLHHHHGRLRRRGPDHALGRDQVPRRAGGRGGRDLPDHRWRGHCVSRLRHGCGRGRIMIVHSPATRTCNPSKAAATIECVQNAISEATSTI